jgi:hypothetical protein
MTAEYCDNCSLAGIIRGHVSALMQIAAIKLPEYGINDETKCLSTAVALAYCLLGENALKTTRYCDVTNVIKRYANSDPSPDLSDQLAKRLLNINKNTRRYVWYVMITDGYMVNAKDPSKKIYLPGHVFIIERNSQPCQDNFFSIYQSYIRHYDLDQYLNNVNSGMKSYEYLKFIAEELVYMFHIPIWDKRCSMFWRKFTLAPGDQFEGCKMENIKLCFSEIPLNTCTGSLKGVLTNALKEIQGKSPNVVYGNASKMKNILNKPLTNGQISQHILHMLSTIETSDKNSYISKEKTITGGGRTKTIKKRSQK